MRLATIHELWPIDKPCERPSGGRKSAERGGYRLDDALCQASVARAGLQLDLDRVERQLAAPKLWAEPSMAPIAAPQLDTILRTFCRHMRRPLAYFERHAQVRGSIDGMRAYATDLAMFDRAALRALTQPSNPFLNFLDQRLLLYRTPGLWTFPLGPPQPRAPYVANLRYQNFPFSYVAAEQLGKHGEVPDALLHVKASMYGLSRDLACELEAVLATKTEQKQLRVLLRSIPDFISCRASHLYDTRRNQCLSALSAQGRDADDAYAQLRNPVEMPAMTTTELDAHETALCPAPVAVRPDAWPSVSVAMTVR